MLELDIEVFDLLPFWTMQKECSSPDNGVVVSLPSLSEVSLGVEGLSRRHLPFSRPRVHFNETSTRLPLLVQSSHATNWPMQTTPFLKQNSANLLTTNFNLHSFRTFRYFWLGVTYKA